MSDSALAKRNTRIGTDGSVNSAKLRVSDSLSSHERAYGIARSANIAYGKIFGGLHMLPNTYIIGFAKCGTTSLYEYMLEHPDVRGGFVKEVHYFDHGERYMRGTNWYRSNFPSRTQRFITTRMRHRRLVTIDATPRYVNHPHAMRRIKETTPDAKFIALVRNPIERAYSHYTMNASTQDIVSEDLSFADAIRQEQHRISGEYEKMERDEGYYSTEYYGHGYAEGGLYAKWLAPWLDEFGDRVLVLDSDSLAKDTQVTLDRVTDFLGIPRHALGDTGRRNVGDGAPDMDEDTRKYLAEYYAAPNAELGKLLGRSLEWD